jgi:hypothetical protein
MKIVSGFFKFVALILMAIVVVGLPLVLLSRSIGSPLLSAEGLSEIFDADMLASMAENRVQKRQIDAEDSPADQFFSQVMQQMTHEEWAAFFDLSAPPEITSQIYQQVIDGIKDWMGGDSAESVVNIDMRPLKDNILAKDTQVLQMILATLPACTVDDVDQLTAFGEGTSQAIPVCQPPEPFYSIMIEQGKTTLPAQLEIIPDDYAVSLGQMGDDGASLTRVIRLIRSVRPIFRLGWLGLLLVYLIAIPMGARSLPEIFKWAGWPSLLAGVHAMLIGLLLLMSHGSVSSLLARFSSADLPASSMEVLSNFMNGLLSDAARPMLIAAGGMIVWGVAAMIVGSVLSANKKRAEA